MSPYPINTANTTLKYTGYVPVDRLHLDTFINFDSELISPFGGQNIISAFQKFRGLPLLSPGLREQTCVRLPPSGSPQHPPAVLRLLSARLLTITGHARSLPPPPASPS